MSDVPELPQSAQLHYFNEGAANILYRITYTPSAISTPPIEADLHFNPDPTSETTPPPSSITPPESPLSDSTTTLYRLLNDQHPPLLRLRKSLTHLPPTTHQHTNYTTAIVPLLPTSALLPQTLVTLPDSLIYHLNTDLKALEQSGRRSAKRHGTYLAPDRHGVVLQDMSPPPGSPCTTLELKSKWLAQSPTAPSGATRCRTCALSASRSAQREAICPLDLVSNEQTDVVRTVRRLTESQPPTGLDAEHVVNATVAYLLDSQILHRLRELQTQLDPSGVLAVPEDAEVPSDLLKAMTLRDCTLFLRVDGEGRVEGRLADLDLKLGTREKVEYWRGVERELVDGGWYVGGGHSVGCRLGRG